MRGLLGALGFMTLVPVGRGRKWQGAAMVPWFPLVGLFVGSLWAGFDALAGLFLPPGLRAGLDVLFLVLLTGGLHLDGLADAADGLLSHRDREEALRIMRDSHIGTWGVLAVVSVLSLKGLALWETSGESRWVPLILIPAYGRLAMVIAMHLLPYGRGEEGIAHGMFTQAGRFHWIWWAGILGAGSVLAGWPDVLVMNVAFGVAVMGLLALYSSRMGCVTGDMLGAMGEVTETGMLVALSIRW
jgi:adenosylcobinamide-GDP ribazoletransferase